MMSFTSLLDSSASVTEPLRSDPGVRRGRSFCCVCGSCDRPLVCLQRSPAVDPGAEALHALLGPGRVARHRPVREGLVDCLCVLPHVPCTAKDRTQTTSTPNDAVSPGVGADGR